MAGADYYFSVIVTLTTAAIKYHGKVILMRERMQVWTERNYTCLVSFCEEVAIIHEGLRQYKEAISHYGYSSVVRE